MHVLELLVLLRIGESREGDFDEEKFLLVRPCVDFESHNALIEFSLNKVLIQSPTKLTNTVQ